MKEFAQRERRKKENENTRRRPQRLKRNGKDNKEI
jgi:hypothetical protein